MNRSTPLLALVAIAFALSLAACEKKEGPMEKAGKSIDNAAAKVGDKVEKAGDKIQDAVKK